MPPKKDLKKQEQEDKSGIPKKTVKFELSFQIREKNLSNYFLFIDWVNGTVEGQIDKMEIGLIENWNLVQEVEV